MLIRGRINRVCHTRTSTRTLKVNHNNQLRKHNYFNTKSQSNTLIKITKRHSSVINDIKLNDMTYCNFLDVNKDIYKNPLDINLTKVIQDVFHVDPNPPDQSTPSEPEKQTNLLTLEQYFKKSKMTSGSLLGLGAVSSGVFSGSLLASMAACAHYNLSFKTFLSTFYGTWFISTGSTLYHNTKYDRAESDKEKLRRLRLFCISLSMTMTPIFLHVITIFYPFIPHMMTIFLAMMGGSISASVTTKIPTKDAIINNKSESNLLKHSIRHTVAWGLFGAITSTAAPSIIGLNGISFGQLPFGVDLCIALIFAVLYNVSDTHKIINDYKNKKIDHIRHAYTYFIKFILISIVAGYLCATLMSMI